MLSEAQAPKKDAGLWGHFVPWCHPLRIGINSSKLLVWGLKIREKDGGNGFREVLVPAVLGRFLLLPPGTALLQRLSLDLGRLVPCALFTLSSCF